MLKIFFALFTVGVGDTDLEYNMTKLAFSKIYSSLVKFFLYLCLRMLKSAKKNFENIWTYFLKTVEKMPIFKFEIQLKRMVSTCKHLRYWI